MTSTVFLPPAGAGASGDPPRVMALKQRVGYEAALATERSGEHVALDLKLFPVPATLRDWALVREVDSISDTEVELSMRFTQGPGVVSVSLTVFHPQERKLVAAKLIDRANAVTRAEVTDTRGPKELGSLSLTPGSGGTVYWIFRNVFAEVVVYRAEVDKLDVARSIQHHLEASLRPS